MEIISLLLAPVAFIGFIWLLIVGFKKSIPWGFGLLVAPLTILLLALLFIQPNSIASIVLISAAVYTPAIAFAYKNWEEAQKAFLTYFISSLLSVIISTNSLTSNKGDNLEFFITQMQQGQISAVDAAQRMRSLIEKIEDSSSLSEQEKLIMRTAKTIITQVEANIENDPDFYDKTINKSYQQDLAKIAAQRKREESIKKLEARLNKRTEAENKVQEKKQKALPIIKKSEIKKYIKSKILIVTISGIKHRGMLKEFDSENYSVIMEHERKTGKLIFKIHMSDIKTIYLYIDE